MRRILVTTAAIAALGTASVGDAAAQTALVNLGADYTPAFAGDDFEGLEGGFGFHGGVLFPLGPLSHIGAELGWSGLDYEAEIIDDALDSSLLDIAGVVNVGLGDGEGARPYIDLRAGYGRLSFDAGTFEGDISGPMAGGGIGFRFRPGGVWIDVNGRYQHYWFGEFDDEALVFDNESSGGRIVLGAGLSIPLGGGR